MRLRPIPFFLLPDKIRFFSVKAIDENGKKEYNDEIVIDSVRVEQTKAKVINADGEKAKDEYILYFDFINSLSYKIIEEEIDGEVLLALESVNPVFHNLDKIIYKDNELYIRQIENFHNHHLEMRLY
jgi:hypothetical protein